MNKENGEAGQQQGHPLIWSVIALLFLALIATFGYKYNNTKIGTVIATAPLDAQCLLNERSCSSTLQNAQATLQIGPSPIVATIPMQVTLQTQGIDAKGVEIHFQGESMNMGLNQFRMNAQGGGRFTVEAILPVCVRNSMMWIAEVLVTTSQGTLVFPFRFESRHP